MKHAEEENNGCRLISWDDYAKLFPELSGRNICVFAHPPNDLNCKTHFHDFFSIIYARTHKGRFVIDGYEYPDTLGKVILLQPLTPHSITGPDESWENNDIAVLIKKEVVQDYIYHSLLSSPVFSEFFISAFLSSSKENIVLSCGEPNSVIPSLFKKMLEESILNCDFSEAILITLLVQVLLELSRSKEMHKPQRGPGKLRADEIIRYICEHSRTVTLQSAANYFNYHPNYITQTLREERGQSFVSIKHDFLLKNARILLEKTSYPIRDVAQLAGFESINFFFRVFKRTYGVTPMEYRELHQQGLHTELLVQ